MRACRKAYGRLDTYAIESKLLAYQRSGRRAVMGYVPTEPVLRRRALEVAKRSRVEAKALTWRFYIGIHVAFGAAAFALGVLILATA